MRLNNYQIGMFSVVLFVVLRLSIGCHFLYEGAWKIQHRDEFSAEPFLTQAKGPAAPLFYAMVPDIDGRQTLRVVEGEDGSQLVRAPRVARSWNRLHAEAVDRHELNGKQKTAADALLKRYQRSLREYLDMHGDEIVGYFGSLERLEADKRAANNGAPHQRTRLWDRQQALRTEVKAWFSEIDGMGEDFRLALWDLLEDDQKAQGMPAYQRTRMDWVNCGVTYGLTAIGLCLVLGLFTRLSCLGGAVFLISVLLSQPSWPSIYPPAPAVLGHALVVDKNFVEMVALLLMATTAVGRWGGLDFFVHRLRLRMRNNVGKRSGDNAFQVSLIADPKTGAGTLTEGASPDFRIPGKEREVVPPSVTVR